MNNIISVSGGNDSIAMLQWVIENRQHFDKKDKWFAVYANTGWAISWWADRIKEMSKFCYDNNIQFYEIHPKLEFTQLVRKKGVFPSGLRKYCTQELKVKPFIDWRAKMGFNCDNAILFIGVRAEESRARTNTVSIGERDGLEAVYPLAYVLEKQRDELIKRTGFKVLPHRSCECHPCIYEQSKANIRAIEPAKIEIINNLEIEISDRINKKRKEGGSIKYKEGEIFGFYTNKNLGSNGGIKQQRAWANTTKGNYNAGQLEIFACEQDYCGG